MPNTYASNTVYFRLCFSTDGSSLEFSEGTPRLWEHDEGSSLNSSICGGTRAFAHKFCISSFVSSYSDVKPILAYCTFRHMRFGSPRSDCLRLVPYICSRLLHNVSKWFQNAPDCSRFTEKMLPDVRVMQISPRSTPAEFGKKTIGAFRVKKSSVMKAKLGRQKKSNQEKPVQSQSIPRHEKDSSIDSDAGHTASN